MREFAVDIVRELNIGEHNTRVGVVRYDILLITYVYY